MSALTITPGILRAGSALPDSPFEFVPVALQLKADGRVADVRVYAYRDIGTMLDDLDAGRIAAVMKLAPVMRWYS